MPTATRPNDNWDDYRYFLAVARAGTLSAAAERLGTEHTTVARHIHALERALNARLFHKSHVGYALTDAGERLLATAEAIESALLASRAAAVGEQEIAGIVRIGAPDGFGSMFLAPRIHALIARHPRLEVVIFAAARTDGDCRPDPDRLGHSAGGLTPPLRVDHLAPARDLRRRGGHIRAMDWPGPCRAN
jgi:DNA-binding transcriptional LysR family regulator